MTKRSNRAEAHTVARTLSPFVSSRLCALAFGDEELSALCNAGLAERRGGWHRVTPLGVAVAEALGPDGEGRVKVVWSYDPYPEQVEGFSYGLSQNGSRETMVGPGAGVQVLVPRNGNVDGV